jgi:extradiol dioxygenase family protein
MKQKLPPFHLAIPVHDLAKARAFYGGLLNCPEGRSAARWVDFNLYGHQLVCHLTPLEPGRDAAKHLNPVDNHDVPVPHFGVVLDRVTWDALARRLQDAGVKFLIEPHVRFRGLAGEQATMFLLDPSGNALEFKAFDDVASGLFAT